MLEELGVQLCEGAESITKEIMADWGEIGSREPWNRLPPTMDHDHLPDMIRSLADTALITFFADEKRAALAWVAVHHGWHRFEFGVAEETLHREYDLLRGALWKRLRQNGPPSEASHAIIRLDSALSFAHGASLRGYHRRAIEASHEWPATVERYIEEWQFFR